MARDYIKIDTSTTTAIHAGTLKSFVHALRDAYEQGLKVKAIMAHNHDGSVFTDIETLFGVPAGMGQTVFDLVNGTVGSMEGTFKVADAKNLTERVG